MPKYLIEMHDGRKFQVEADSQPSEADVLAHMGTSAPKLDTVSDKEPGTYWGGVGKSLVDQFTAAVPAVAPSDQAAGLWQGHKTSPQTEKFMTTPLVHPTGIDAVDGFASPAGLAMLAGGALTPLQDVPINRSTIGRAMRFVGDNADITKPLKFMSKAGEYLEKSAPKPPPPEPVAPAGPHMDLSKPIPPSQLTQQQIGERIAANQAAGGVTPPPVDKPPLGGRLRPAITVAPESPMQPPAEASPSMQQPRVQIGAEAVGRQTGLSKDAVRAQTGPLFNEAPGSASPVVPQTPFERMHDKLLSMGHGNPEREAYVQAAKDPKTAGQLEILRRTLERNGLAVGGATAMGEAMRRAILGRLTGDSTEQQ